MLSTKFWQAMFCLGLGIAVFQFPAFGQEYAQLFPEGAGRTLMERDNVVVPSDGRFRSPMKGRIYHQSPDEFRDSHTIKIKKMRRKTDRDDTVYGKTLQLNIGMGGAFLY
jgi:hypothetical protein